MPKLQVDRHRMGVREKFIFLNEAPPLSKASPGAVCVALLWKANIGKSVRCLTPWREPRVTAHDWDSPTSIIEWGASSPHVTVVEPVLKEPVLKDSFLRQRLANTLALLSTACCCCGTLELSNWSREPRSRQWEQSPFLGLHPSVVVYICRFVLNNVHPVLSQHYLKK